MVLDESQHHFSCTESVLAHRAANRGHGSIDQLATRRGCGQNQVLRTCLASDYHCAAIFSQLPEFVGHLRDPVGIVSVHTGRAHSIAASGRTEGFDSVHDYDHALVTTPEVGCGSADLRRGIHGARAQ